MTNNKLTGSFYTPEYIASFVCKIALNKIKKLETNILEPSAGDGIFITSLFRNLKKTQRLNIKAIEISYIESEKIKSIDIPKGSMVNVINDDFLLFQENNENKFDLIIGNPPYIKRNLLSNEQIEICKRVNNNFTIDDSISFKNIWPAFLLASIRLLGNEGVLALILPAELLQVKYAKFLREVLTDNFERIEIYTFNELIFKACKGQDTLVLIAQKKSNSKGLFFHNIIDTYNLDYDIKFVKHDVSSNFKWSSHILDKDELLFIEKIINKLPILADLSTSKAGIVTAANDFFIINNKKLEELNLNKEDVKHIIQKASFLGKGIVINESEIQLLENSNTPCYLLDLSHDYFLENSNIKAYIKLGENLDLPSRFKMKQRLIWYKIPNIIKASPVLFFKRCHEFPRMLRNISNILATDSAYMVYPNDNISADGLVNSFYNSVTMIMAEIQGRYYGGGVLELTPSEFRSLPIPYFYATTDELEQQNNLFLNCVDFQEILKENDKFLLRKYLPNITDDELNWLNLIRLKLVRRRQRL